MLLRSRPLAASAFTLVLVVGGALGALSCSSTDAEPAPAPPAAGTTAAPAPRPPPKGPQEEPAAPDPLTDPDAGDCTGAAGSLYALIAKTLSSAEPLPMCRFAGKVLLIVNVASQCGYTPQYTPLEALYRKYATQGFYVLGFPSKSFNQELDTEADISAFCTNTYKITFPMFALGNVNPPDEQPVYTWLKAQPGYEAPIPWNFEKWLVSRAGTVAKRIDYTTSPDDPSVLAAIEAELAKP